LEFIPEIYQFTNSDAEELKFLGYQLISDNIDSFIRFMQTKFRNFNLLALLKVVDKQFSDTTDKYIIREIRFEESSNKLRINYHNGCDDEDNALAFVREFSVKANAIKVNHIYCVIPKSSRNKGLIKPVFRESLQQYVNCNAKVISVHAGLSGGGYTWARHGFCATIRSEVDFILQEAKKLLSNHEFGVVEKIYNTYYYKNPKGKAFPMDLWAALDFMKPVLMGSDWHGELNLKNKEQFRNFKDYVSR